MLSSPDSVRFCPLAIGSFVGRTMECVWDEKRAAMKRM